MAKIETVSYTNEAFKSYLMRLSDGIIWKNDSLSKKYEVNTDPYLVELFLTANRGILNFNVIQAFPRSVLRMIGIPESDIEMCAADKNKIPQNRRKDAVSEYQTALSMKNPTTGRLGYETASEGWVSIYEEQNDYYRMLNGLPSINDTNYIYNTDTRWTTDIPVHELPLIDRLEMEDAGVLDSLIKKYPEAEYLKYCGSKMIDIFTARVANRFEILWKHNVDSSTLEEDFSAVYDSCCNLVNSVFYSDAFKKTNALYENFLAMSILFMTIQTMQYHYLSVDVIRDFYDTESLKYVYDSYSVPFYNEIPLEYHRKIVKNINKLIGYKGSSQVFFDLFDIFDTNMNIYTYYLTKVHRFDEHGNPEFTIKKDEQGNPMYDENGDPILAPSNYDITFARGEIYQDPSLSVADPLNKSEYETITIPDPYWIEDANIKKVLEDTSFNFNETKYIGVQTSFDLLKIAYENAYVFKMIMDNKTITSRLVYQWIDLGIEASLYQIFIYLAALVCKYHGYEGLISDKLPYTAAVLGYDFKASLTIIKDNIDKNPYLRNNTELKERIRGMSITNALSVDTTLANMQAIESMLMSGYLNASTREEFNAYRDLYNTLMTSKIIDEVYTKPDGTVAESFSDLLRSRAPDLYTRYINLEEGSIEDELTVIIDKIEEIITNLKYSPHSLGIESSSLIDNLFRILRFFKSAKAEMIGYNVIYMITMRGVNFFKLVDEWVKYHLEGKITEDSYVYDFLTYTRSILKFKRELTVLKDQDQMTDQTYNTLLTDKIDWTNDLLMILKQIFPPMEDITKYWGFLISEHYSQTLRDLQQTDDKVDIVDQFFPKGPPIYTFKDPMDLLDLLIMKAALNFILEDLTLEDFLKSVDEKVFDYIRMNEDSIIQNETLQELLNSELKSVFTTYVYKEAKAYYSGMTLDSKINMIDRFLVYAVVIEKELSLDAGLPGLESLIEISAAYKQMIFDKHEQYNKLDLVDYAYQKGDYVGKYNDLLNLIDIYIEKVGTQYVTSKMDLEDYIHTIYEMIYNQLKLDSQSIIKKDSLIPLNKSQKESNQNDNYFGFSSELEIDEHDKKLEDETDILDDITYIKNIIKDHLKLNESSLFTKDEIRNTSSYKIKEIIDNYIMKNIKAKYTYQAIHDKMSYADQFLIDQLNTTYSDDGPMMVSILTKMKMNQISNDSNQMRDSIYLSDGSSL